MSEPPSAWRRAVLALHLLALDPPGLGGIVLRARAGPVRDAFVALAGAVLGPLRRLSPGMAEDHLFGGLDLAATLSAGRPVHRAGLLDAPGPVVMGMVERAPPLLAARLAQVVGRPGACLIALDESADDEEGAARALTDRLAFHVDLDGVALGEVGGAAAKGSAPASAAPIASAPAAISGDDLAALARLAAALGVGGGRADCLAMRAALAHARLAGRAAVEPVDLEVAAALVLAPRAARLPEPAEAPPPEAPAEVEAEPGPSGAPAPDEMLIAAVRAVLPPDLMARMAARRTRLGAGSGSGAARVGNRRGRPLAPRPGRPDGRARIDLPATLRRAAPWQRVRRAADPDRTGILVRPSDVALARAEQKSDRLLIFVVDASGSAAMARLGEAKGAVELMLAAAYARRDHVALVGFRGREAQTLLPPTRSLVRTKRRLASLPGGGATPLAAGLRAGLAIAEGVRGRGMTPTVVLLSDGRANVALGGEADRARAAADAETVAGLLRRARVEALVIDTGQRRSPALERLSGALAGAYLPLPRADARGISRAVSALVG